jgi:hypothetical protein
LLAGAVKPAQRLPDRGQQALGHLYRQLTVCRKERGDDLAVILSGQDEPLRKLLQANPPLAARFRAVVEFPGFGPAQLSAIFGKLADEAMRTGGDGAGNAAGGALRARWRSGPRMTAGVS